MTTERNLSPATDPRIAFFDKLAVEWDDGEQDPAETVARLEALEDLLYLESGQRLLEVGCGTGQITGWLVEQVHPAEVVAVDFSDAMLTQAKAKGVEAEFRRADVCSDSLGEGCFDVILCFHSFPHFRDQAAALANLARALAPGGRFLVTHLNSAADVNAFHDQVGGEVAGDHLPEADAWDPLLSAAGLVRQKLIDRQGLFFLEARKA
jgi:demethylmenaquinone methyltransferase/2-methoxy-6-polyprenyl-1,4-benzoquinol methylase